MPNNDIKISADIQLNTSSLDRSLDQLKGRISSTLNKVTSSGAEKGFENIVSKTQEAVVQTENYETKLKSLQAQLQTAIAEAHKGNAVFGASDQYKNAISSVAEYQRKIEELQTALAENARNASLPQAIQMPSMSVEQIAQAEQQISQYQAKIQELEATMTSMETRGTAFPALSQGIKEAEVELSASATQALLLQQNLEAVSGTAPTTGSAVQQSMQIISQSVAQGAQQVQQAKQTMSQPADMQTVIQTINALVVSVDNLTQSLQGASSGFSSMGQSAASVGKTAHTSLGSAGKSFRGTLSDISSSLKSLKAPLKRGFTTILKYGFGVRSLYFLFRRLRNAVKEGLQNLVKYEKAVGTSTGKVKGIESTNQAITNLRSALLYLKNAWAAAFAPIINVVSPILVNLINLLADAGNYIARFVGALTGQKKVLQAVKVSAGDYATSLDKSSDNANKASKAQKKLNDRLAQFDDLNVLGKDDDSAGAGSGAGGGSTTGPDPKDMFKYVNVDDSEFADILAFIDKIKKAIEESGIIDAVKEFWEAVQKFKDSPLAQLLKDIAIILLDTAFRSALSTVATVFKLLADILNGDLKNGLQDFKKLIANLTFDPLIALAKVFDKIFKTDIAGWLESVKQSIEDIDLSQLPGYESMMDALDKLKTAWDNLKTAVKEFADKLEETGVLDIVTTFITNLVSAGFEGILQGIATALGLVAGVLQTIADLLNGDWVNVIQDLKDILSTVTFDPWITIASILDTICGTDLSGWLKGVKDGFDSLKISDIAQAFSDFFESVKTKFDGFVATIQDGWEKVKSAFWLAVGIISAVLGITDEKFIAIKSTIIASLETIRNGFVTVWTTIKSFLIASVTSIQSTFQTIWTNIKTFIIATLQTLASTIKSIWEKIEGYVRTPVNVVIKVINSLIKGLETMLNGLAKTLNKIKIDIPNWVPEWGGKSLGFNIQTISLPKVPELAQGAVIPPNKEFMAILGDQSHGTNIEAPLDTIKQAVAEVVGNNGSAEMIQLLQQLIMVVENKNLTIGDKEIGRANARFNKQQSIVRGTSF